MIVLCLQTVDMDPCLDDCIMLAKKLRSLGVTVGIDVLAGLPHGFLSFVKVITALFIAVNFVTPLVTVLQLSKEAHEGSRVCINRLAELLENADESHC